MLLGSWEAALITEVATLLGTIWFELEPAHTWIINADDQPQFWLYLVFLAAANVLLARSELARRNAQRAAMLRAQILATNPSSIITFDPNGMVLFANQAAFDLVGVRTGDRIGVDFDSENWARETLDGVDLPHYLTPFRVVLAEGATITNWRYRLRPPDGRWRVVSTSAAPILDPRGRVARVVATTTDITEQYAAEETARTQREMVELVTRRVPAVVFQWEAGEHGARGQYLLMTDRVREILHLDPDALCAGESMLDHIIPADRVRVAAIVADAVRTRTNWDFECTVRRDDNALVRIHSLAGPAQLPGDRWVWNGIFLDVTKQRRMEADLLQAQKTDALGQLAGGVAHDFNNMLTAILGYTDILALELPAEQYEARADVAQIREAVERASWLTRQLLAFTRQAVVAPRDLDVAVTVAEMDKFLQRVIGEQVTVVVLPSADPCVVYADPVHVQQVLLNLVVNARDAMPNGGTIIIAVGRLTADDAPPDGGPAGDYVTLQVRDDGVGIPDDVLPAIFDPFFTTKPVGKGTGIGLATVRSIVEAMHGRIQVVSTVGHGTTFTILIPAVQTPAESAGAEPSRGANALPIIDTPRRIVLMVEDDPRVRAIARRVLVKAGYSVIEAQHPAEAFALVAQRGERLDLVITDLVMPGMSGTALVEQLRRSRPYLQAVYISGFTSEDMSAITADAARSRFLAKPFSPEDLLEAVEALLASSR
jgi:PAS domain S-box-containing protein